MLTALSRNPERKVIAHCTEKSEGPFFCPECGDELLIRKGKIRVHHFAHIPPTNCIYGSGESQAHLKCKVEIFDALKNDSRIDKLELERRLDGVRPDISFRVDGCHYVAIEVQISDLSLDDIERRTKRYKELKVNVCWILQMNDEIWGERFAPRVWEKWAHLLYFGRVYYWTGGTKVIPAHFDEHMLEVPHTSWHVEGGEERTAGGYYRVSKKYKEARIHDPIDLIQDFDAVQRDRFSTSKLDVPAAWVWADQLEKWW